MRRRTVIVLSVGFVVVAGLAYCGNGAYFVYKLATSGLMSADDFAAVTVGAPEAQARKRLPDQKFARPARDVYGTQAGADAATPPGAACVHDGANLASQGDNADGMLVYRFCFKDSALVDKDAIRSTSATNPGSKAPASTPPGRT